MKNQSYSTKYQSLPFKDQSISVEINRYQSKVTHSQ